MEAWRRVSRGDFYFLLAVSRVPTFQSISPPCLCKGHEQKAKLLYDEEMIYKMYLMHVLDLKMTPCP